MLQNAYFVAKIGADTAENELHFAEILPKTGNYPTGPRSVAAAQQRLAGAALRGDGRDAVRRAVRFFDLQVRTNSITTLLTLCEVLLIFWKLHFMTHRNFHCIHGPG